MSSVFICAFGTSMSFYLLLSVVPLYVGGLGAGFATGALMFATVAAELVTPALLARFGYRRVFAAGMVLLGVPALALPVAHSLAAVLAICAVRGVGFAITVVVSIAVVAVAVPSERRGEGLGLYGIVVNVPAIIGLPLGVWLATNVGYTPVFVAGACAALAGLVVVPGLPTRAPSADAPIALGTAARNPALFRIAIIFAATTLAAGAVATFLALAVGRGAALALFVQAAAATLSRWWAGRFGDRHGPARLFRPSVLIAAVGIAALVLINRPAAVLIGMLVFGIGFGAAQNASLAMMYDRVSASGYDTISALWNLAYDVGYGLGGAGFGLLALRAGYPLAFGATAVLIALTLVRTGQLSPAYDVAT
ncbi:MAG TPA: MFS transporter [Gemmatimonadaceae bacterium]|nr:MFS transporter [Gemmatimonadaceae bacterium]